MNNSLSIHDVLDLPIFKCKKCKRRCQYPVMIVDKIENYCQTCLTRIQCETSEPNIEINKILEKFIVPCRFNDRGCDIVDKIVSLSQHEKVCELRDKVCPFYNLGNCDTKIISNIVDHFKVQHPACILESNDEIVQLSFNTQNFTNLDVIRLLHLYNDYFLLHIKFNVDSKELLYVLYLCGEPDDMKNYKCSVEQQNNDIHIKSKDFKLLHESDFTTPIVKNNAVRFDLSTIQRCFDKIETVVKVSARNGLSNIKNSDLLTHVKCPICKIYMREKIFQCSSGHSACNDCTIELQVCPICQSTYCGTRNYTLENLTALMKFPCIHRGCNKYFSKKNIYRHEGTCSFKQYACPFSNTFHCRWVGNHKEIMEHLKSDHANNSTQNNICERKILMDVDSVEVYALMAFGNVFRFHHEKVANMYSFSCKYFGPNILAKTFMFEIGIVNQNKKDNKFIIKHSWSDSNEDELWVEIHRDDIEHFSSSQSDILVYYKVMKCYE